MSAVERLNQLTRQSAHTAARLRFGRRGTAALRSQGGQVSAAGRQCPRPPRWGALCTRGDGQSHATSRSAATSRPVSAHRHRHPLSGARGGCASVPRWSGGGGGQAVSMAARLGGAVHPWRRPGPCGEPKRGDLASCEAHRRCTAAATPERCAHGCASARGWSGGGVGLALLFLCVSLLPLPRTHSVVTLPQVLVASLGGLSGASLASLALTPAGCLHRLSARGPRWRPRGHGAGAHASISAARAVGHRRVRRPPAARRRGPGR